METNLSNWRTAPHNTWSFQNVSAILRGDTIKSGQYTALAQGLRRDLDQISFTFQGAPTTVSAALDRAATDGFLVLHKGRVLAEYYPNLEPARQHILFSVSKSVTGTLTGILVAEGRLDPNAPVTEYVPEVAQSAYRDCTVRHVLDMVVDVNFIEDYLDTKGDFARYRVATGFNPPNPQFGNVALHGFLATVKPAASRHGEKFDYVSTNSDLLGWILERAIGQRFSDLLGEKICLPLGFESDVFIATDAEGSARTAGGICMSLRDLARFAEMVRIGGAAHGKQIVPQDWITDIRVEGSSEAWGRGSMTHLFPKGSYRSKWYKSNDADGSIYAIGIHGQWVYINSRAELTIVKFSSQALPVDDTLDLLNLQMFEAIASGL
jgi:CubicO group peptidase (beta-lactamase class C family)